MEEMEIVRAVINSTPVKQGAEYVRLSQYQWNNEWYSELFNREGKKMTCLSTALITEKEEREAGELWLKANHLIAYKPMFVRNKVWKHERLKEQEISSKKSEESLSLGTRSDFSELRDQIAFYNAAAKNGTIKDEHNPMYLFSTADLGLVKQIADGRIDVQQLAIMQLMLHGVDQNLKWVGFPKAEEIAQQRIESLIKKEREEQLDRPESRLRPR